MSAWYLHNCNLKVDGSAVRVRFGSHYVFGWVWVCVRVKSAWKLDDGGSGIPLSGVKFELEQNRWMGLITVLGQTGLCKGHKFKHDFILGLPGCTWWLLGSVLMIIVLPLVWSLRTGLGPELSLGWVILPLDLSTTQLLSLSNIMETPRNGYWILGTG